MVMPITQWFGSGFGQNGSTSNRGATAPFAWTTARLPTTLELIPSAASRTINTSAILRFLFMLFLLAFAGLKCSLLQGSKSILNLPERSRLNGNVHRTVAPAALKSATSTFTRIVVHSDVQHVLS